MGVELWEGWDMGCQAEKGTGSALEFPQIRQESPTLPAHSLTQTGSGS